MQNLSITLATVWAHIQDCPSEALSTQQRTWIVLSLLELAFLPPVQGLFLQTALLSQRLSALGASWQFLFPHSLTCAGESWASLELLQPKSIKTLVSHCSCPISVSLASPALFPWPTISSAAAWRG